MGWNAQVLGISVDHIPCLQAWAESLGGISFPLLSDFWPHGAAADLYDVFRRDEGRSERAIFVIDSTGFIRYIDVHDIDDQPDNEQIYAVLRQLTEEQPVSGLSARYASESAGVFVDEPDAEEIPAGDVILYCARWCKDCRKTRAWLEDHGLQYVEVDIDYNLAARARIRQLGGGRLITPVVELYGEVVLDYDPFKMETILARRAGY